MPDGNGTAVREIGCFFTLSSPWAYLGHPLFVSIAARYRAAIRFRPMAVGLLFGETGGLPLPRRHPVRQRYRLVELQRWRERRSMPLLLQPRSVPFDASLADRCVIALSAAGRDPEPFIRRASAGVWAEERDLADAAVLAEILREVGVEDAAAVLEHAGAPETAGLYAANGAAALAAGVFGAPSYVLDGEVFWGQDRLELLDEALASARPAFRP